MSVELPEAKILAEQMNNELHGKRIKSTVLKDYKRLQRIGMMNKDVRSFDQLVNREILSVISRGNVILVKLDRDINLIIAPEYGGNIFYHTTEKTLPKKFHLKVDFNDGTMLTVRLLSMGLIFVMKDENLKLSYIYNRDFNPDKPSPVEEGFTFETFSEQLQKNNKMLKSVLVGKDAILVGLSNSAFQDIIYRARLHPKRKAAELKNNERQALYDAIRLVIQERIKLKGKDVFQDLYGNQGGYVSAMGPNMKEQNCLECGSSIERLNIGGGHVYFCPECQT